MIGLVSCSKKLDVASTQSTASPPVAWITDRRIPVNLVCAIEGDALKRTVLQIEPGPEDERAGQKSIVYLDAVFGFDFVTCPLSEIPWA
ncbi:hypothetical protein Tco_1333424 [Tanacetum coccineum]